MLRIPVCDWLATATLFHGTDLAGLERLKPSDTGTLGPGVYFTAVHAQAAEYGERVYAAQVKLFRPWVIDLELDSEGALREDLDSASVEAVLTLPLGRALLDEAKRSDGNYGAELQGHLREFGYDGIVGTHCDGSMEIVVFDESNIQFLGEAPAQSPVERQLV